MRVATPEEIDTNFYTSAFLIRYYLNASSTSVERYLVHKCGGKVNRDSFESADCPCTPHRKYRDLYNISDGDAYANFFLLPNKQENIEVLALDNTSQKVAFHHTRPATSAERLNYYRKAAVEEARKATENP